MPQDVTSSILASMGQLVDLLRTHHPSVATTATTAASSIMAGQATKAVGEATTDITFDPVVPPTEQPPLSAPAYPFTSTQPPPRSIRIYTQSTAGEPSTKTRSRRSGLPIPRPSSFTALEIVSDEDQA